MLEFILNQIENPNFLINFATFIAFLIVVMVVINVYDYYTITKRFNDIDKKYKQLRKGIK